MYVKHLCYMGRAYAEHMQNVCKVKRGASDLKTKILYKHSRSFKIAISVVKVKFAWALKIL